MPAIKAGRQYYMRLHDLHRAGLVLLLGFVIARFGGVVFKFICMNQMTPEAYGNVAIFLVLYNWLVLLATLGITLGLMRFISRNPGKAGRYFRASLAGCFGISILVMLILILISPGISGILNISSPFIVYILAVSLPFAAVYNLVIFYFRGQYRMTSSVLGDFSLMVVRIALLVFLFYMTYQYAPYLAFLLSFLILDIFLLLKTGTGRGVCLGREFRILLIYSLPIFVAEFLRFFSLGLDRLFLAGFHGTAEAGLYDIAVSLCLGYLIIANSYGNALLPAAAKRGGEKGGLRKSLKGTLALYVLYTVIILLVANPLITLINPQYLPVLGFLAPMIIAYILIGFFIVLTFFVNGIGLQRYAVYSALVFAFLSLLLNFYLVPGLKYMGAIEALIVSGIVSLSLLGGLVWKAKAQPSK